MLLRPTEQSIAAARTFGYKADEKKLRDMGLIRGAGPENAIVLGPEGPENGPLRFSDEYVRHKVLDLIGDLALAGRRIEGHVVAERAGHAMHTALVSRLMKDRSAWELARVPMVAAADDARRCASARRAPRQPGSDGRLNSASLSWPFSYNASRKHNAHWRRRRKALALAGQLAGFRDSARTRSTGLNSDWPPASSAPSGPE